MDVNFDVTGVPPRVSTAWYPFDIVWVEVRRLGFRACHSSYPITPIGILTTCHPAAVNWLVSVKGVTT